MPPGRHTSRLYPCDQVIHFRWNTEPNQPWAGISPLGATSLGATAAANVETKIGEEGGGPTALLLPVPTDGAQLDDLAGDIKSAKGGAVLAEAPSTGWDEGRQAAGTRRDWVGLQAGARDTGRNA